MEDGVVAADEGQRADRIALLVGDLVGADDPGRVAGAGGGDASSITVSPRGGILLCEDGRPVTDEYGPGTRLLGLTADGDSYTFAKNSVDLTLEQLVAAGKRIFPDDYRGQEMAGACFDPAGEVLFVNIQRPGITCAIWGPWERGNL
ncbi:MAG: DUF839 domain-containing protein [Sphingomonadales bacterium]|nr:DUF839 domain-containing protein [Sphingomonadales bacterium]